MAPVWESNKRLKLIKTPWTTLLQLPEVLLRILDKEVVHFRHFVQNLQRGYIGPAAEIAAESKGKGKLLNVLRYSCTYLQCMYIPIQQTNTQLNMY